MTGPTCRSVTRPPRSPVLSLTDLVLTQDELAEVIARLVSIMQDFTLDRDKPSPEARHYHFLFAGYLAPGGSGAP